MAKNGRKLFQRRDERRNDFDKLSITAQKGRKRPGSLNRNKQWVGGGKKR